MLDSILLSFLDAFFSLPVWIYIIMMGLWFIIIRYIVIRVKAHVVISFIFLLISVIGIPITLSVLNNNRWGYGYLHESRIPYFGVSEQYVAVNDLHVTHGKGKTSYHHRLYLVDAQNGGVLFKKPVNSKSGIKGLSLVNDQLLVKSGNKSKYFSLKGTSRKAFRKSQLKDLPELKSGIYKYGYNANSNQVWAINKQGEKFFYNGTTMKREKERITGASTGNTFVKITGQTKTYFSTTKKRRRYKHHPYYCPVGLKGKIRRQLILENGEQVEKFFVYGNIAMYFPKAKVALIKSYATTDKKQFVLTAVNLQGEVLWQKTPLKLGVTDFFSRSNPRIPYVTPAMYDGDFVILIGGYLMRMNPETGTIRWQTRL